MLRKTAFITGLLICLSAAAFEDHPIINFFEKEVIEARYLEEKIPIEPEGEGWEQTKGKEVELCPQTAVRLNDKRANHLLKDKENITATVKVVYNGENIAVYLEWTDGTLSLQTGDDLNSYSDGVSIQIPQKFGKGITLPHIGMGDYSHPVFVYFLKADNREKLFTLYSKGFGFTEPAGINAEGKMVYDRKEKKWKAVFKIPLQTEQFNTGKDFIPIGFAVWDGEKLERDGNKSVSKWKFIRLDKYEIDGDYLEYISWGYPLETLGNPEEGKRVALKNGCGKCHRFDDQNSAPLGLAPDLSNIGGRANPVYLKEALTNPDDVVVRNLKNVSHSWYTTEGGKLHSKMPPFKNLSEKELKDLIAYLLTLK